VASYSDIGITWAYTYHYQPGKKLHNFVYPMVKKEQLGIWQF